jgi:N-methylhydantoinase A
MLVLGIDIGGTFTDLVLYDTEAASFTTGKVPSVPGRQWEGLAAGLSVLDVDAARLSSVVHGTTVATNAILEGKTARTALVTTEGFRDVLEIGRSMRLTPGSLFDTRFKRPAPLVPRDRRLEIEERIDAEGKVVTPLDGAALERLGAELRALKPAAIALCLINSYANPTHEKRLAAFLKRARIEAPIYTSHEISPEYREYERVSTTVINAAVSPVIDRYLEAFEDTLRRRGFKGSLFVMASNGGTLPRRIVGRLGAHTILSGPVGGVRGALLVAKSIGKPRIITLDMGGTSTDVALIDGHEPEMADVSVINGMPLRLPQLNIVTVGAGGGSLAKLDEGGGVDVGPESAGARPGPACYGFGNDRPTVTDANLVLGRLGVELIGGAMRMLPELAAAAIDRMAAAAGVEPMHLAAGIVEIAVARMANAIREVSVEQGDDPRGFALFAFGGAGPLHGCAVAAELGIREVIVPPYPGHVCAYGLLASELRQDRARTWLRALGDIAAAELLRELKTERVAMLKAVEEAGWPADKIELSYALDLRYLGQAFAVRVELRSLSEPGVAALPADFADRHEELYGHRHERAIEIVTLRVTARAPRAIGFELPTAPTQLDAARARKAGPPPTRPVYERGAWVECPVIQRDTLARGSTLSGPAIIEETGSTTFVQQGWTLRVEDNLTLVLTAAGSPEAQ